MERIAIYKVMENRRRNLGRPIRRESVRTQVVNGIEIMTLVYSARYVEEGLPTKRIYRVATVTATGMLSDAILDMPK